MPERHFDVTLGFHPQSDPDAYFIQKFKVASVWRYCIHGCTTGSVEGWLLEGWLVEFKLSCPIRPGCKKGTCHSTESKDNKTKHFFLWRRLAIG
jgi:hypothetical protein